MAHSCKGQMHVFISKLVEHLAITNQRTEERK